MERADGYGLQGGSGRNPLRWSLASSICFTDFRQVLTWEPFCRMGLSFYMSVCVWGCVYCWMRLGDSGGEPIALWGWAGSWSLSCFGHKKVLRNGENAFLPRTVASWWRLLGAFNNITIIIIATDIYWLLEYTRHGSTHYMHNLIYLL